VYVYVCNISILFAWPLQCMLSADSVHHYNTQSLIWSMPLQSCASRLFIGFHGPSCHTRQITLIKENFSEQGRHSYSTSTDRQAATRVPVIHTAAAAYIYGPGLDLSMEYTVIVSLLGYCFSEYHRLFRILHPQHGDRLIQFHRRTSLETDSVFVYNIPLCLFTRWWMKHGVTKSMTDPNHLFIQWLHSIGSGQIWLTLRHFAGI